MALITCPECGKEISEQAEQCPHCGYPLRKKQQEEKGREQHQRVVQKIIEKRKPIMIVAIAAVVAVVIIVAAAHLAHKAKLVHFLRSYLGSYVTFGSYEQDNYIVNEKEPIEWLVLDYDSANNCVLLLSRYGLDVQPYNTDYKDVTWETCTLRTWLNSTFLNKAFNASEQQAIQTTNVDNSQSQGYIGWNTYGGNNTQDKVFLLSYAEANWYFNVTWEDRNNTESRVSPTAYAKQEGAYTSSSNKTTEGIAAGWWRLRSPGAFQSFAAFVNTDGSLNDDSASYADVCVRPAMWVNLESSNLINFQSEI